MRDLLKPEIEYANLARCVIGHEAIVYTVEHPRLVTKYRWRITSPVLRFIRHEANGPVFETRNSIYRPEETDETLPKASVKRASA